MIRGPSASVWGANAMNGVINIITKSAKDTQGVLLSAGVGTGNRASAPPASAARSARSFTTAAMPSRSPWARARSPPATVGPTRPATSAPASASTPNRAAATSSPSVGDLYDQDYGSTAVTLAAAARRRSRSPPTSAARVAAATSSAAGADQVSETSRRRAAGLLRPLPEGGAGHRRHHRRRRYRLPARLPSLRPQPRRLGPRLPLHAHRASTTACSSASPTAAATTRCSAPSSRTRSR